MHAEDVNMDNSNRSSSGAKQHDPWSDPETDDWIRAQEARAEQRLKAKERQNSEKTPSAGDAQSAA